MQNSLKNIEVHKLLTFEALRDLFVCGLRNRAIQKKLLTEKGLTWKMAVDIAKAMESADRQLSQRASKRGIQFQQQARPI